jgi:DNA-binding NarL/FixJ family response regulator
VPKDLRIFVLDDHDGVRQALAARLSAVPGLSIVGASSEAEPALLELLRLRPDVILVETKRQDGRGLEIVHWVAANLPDARVIVLTSYSYPSEWERWAAVRAGAAAYFLKDINSPQLVEQLRGLSDAKP